MRSTSAGSDARGAGRARAGRAQRLKKAAARSRRCAARPTARAMRVDKPRRPRTGHVPSERRAQRRECVAVCAPAEQSALCACTSFTGGAARRRGRLASPNCHTEQQAQSNASLHLHAHPDARDEEAADAAAARRQISSFGRLSAGQSSLALNQASAAARSRTSSTASQLRQPRRRQATQRPDGRWLAHSHESLLPRARLQRRTPRGRRALQASACTQPAAARGSSASASALAQFGVRRRRRSGGPEARSAAPLTGARARPRRTQLPPPSDTP